MALLDDHEFCKITLAVLLAKLGGVVTIDQTDYDRVFGQVLSEDYKPSTRLLQLRLLQGAPNASQLLS